MELTKKTLIDIFNDALRKVKIKELGLSTRSFSRSTLRVPPKVNPKIKGKLY